MFTTTFFAGAALGFTPPLILLLYGGRLLLIKKLALDRALRERNYYREQFTATRQLLVEMTSLSDEQVIERLTKFVRK